MIWDIQNKALLRKLWSEGLTATEIANRIGGDATKNSVIGMSHRMKLPKRLPPVNMRPKKVKPTPVATPPDNVSPLMIPVEKIRNGQCRFPYGDPRDSGFSLCGHKTRGATKPYCDKHHDFCNIKNKSEYYKNVPEEFTAT